MAVKVNTRRKKTRNKRSSKQRVTNNDIGFIGKALRGLGGLGGSTIGTMLGHPAAGSALGNSLGAAVSRWLGQGDYSVSKNTIVAKASAAIPSMHKSDQSVVIRHKEFLGTITGSTAFTVQQEFVINPGLSATFPWLSNLARSFQEYEIKGMVYHYVPTSGSAVSSTSSALGSVMIQTSYRATDDAPASKVEMLNEYWSNEVVPFETMCHPIECDPKENPFAIHYVRSEPIPSGEPLLYDLGKTFVATQGMQSAYVVGDLWVSYEIEFKKPIVSSNVTGNLVYFAADYTSVPATNLFATEVAQRGNMPITATGKTVTIPKGLVGQFTVLAKVYGPFTANPVWGGPSVIFNCQLDVNGLGAVTDTYYTTVGNNGSIAELYYVIAVTKTDVHVPATITFPTPTWGGGVLTKASLTVWRVDDAQ